MKREDKQKQDIADFRFLMSIKAGRRVVYQLLDDCRIFHSSFAMDDRHTSFNEGKRAIGLKLLKQCNELTPAEYGLMMAEAPDNVIEEEVQQDG